MTKPGGIAASRIPIAVALFLATAGLYLPVGGHPFLPLDDPLYVTENARVRAGLTAEGVRWAISSLDASNWHPLTWISHMADVELFGLDPGPHHLVNVLFHAANAVLLFLLLSTSTGSRRRAAFVAALFAFHPLHVQSVAWVAERKDVLSAFLGLLAMLAWTRYAARPSSARYAAVLALLVLGLAAKPMLVTLPALFLLLDFWPLGRLAAGRERPGIPWRRIRELVLEKLPMLPPVAVASLLTLAAQGGGKAVVPQAMLPVGGRIANALVSCVAYVAKTVLPVSLSIFYPHPLEGIPAWRAGGAAVLLAAATAAALRQAGRRPWLAFGWCWFLVSLLPVLGLVQVGGQAMADRYTYLPLVGLFVVLAWGGAEAVERAGGGRKLAGAAAVLAIALAAAAARREIGYWRSPEALFSRAIEVTEGNWVARFQLGAIEAAAGRLDAAAAQYREAIRIAPAYARAHSNLGALLLRTGALAEARARLEEAVRLEPSLFEARNNLAMALARERRYEEAIAQYREAVRLMPRDSETRSNFGAALQEAGRTAEARAEYLEALRLDPGSAQAHNNLGFLLMKEGRPEEAAARFREAARIAPGNAVVLNNLGDALLAAGRAAEAAEQYRESLRIAPGDAETGAKLGKAAAAAGRRGSPAPPRTP